MGGHKSVASEVVEDVALARRAKRLGLKILTASGTHAVYGRMYNNVEEVRNGFSKNLFGLTGFKTGFFSDILSPDSYHALPFHRIFFQSAGLCQACRIPESVNPFLFDNGIRSSAIYKYYFPSRYNYIHSKNCTTLMAKFS